MFNSLQDQLLPVSASFSDAFPSNLIPDNSDVDKGKCGFGITYAEFFAKRHSILVIHSLSIIEDKYDQYEELSRFKVIGGTSVEEIRKYLLADTGYKNIIVTPESFDKIIEAAKDRLEWLFKTFFCFLDESHCYATDAFREDILKPFNWFFKFTNKSMGSATPFKYSDPRFKQLDKYTIRYKEKFGKISIINAEKPQETLKAMLSNPNEFPGNVHIFFNTVTQCGDAVVSTGVKEVNIFCREEERNMVKLGEASEFFKFKPTTGSYKKFNFYSCRYNEGWDLYDDENATIVLVTDTKVPHSLIGIPFKGFQAVGRLRKVKPNKIYHITNLFNKREVKPFEHIVKECYKAARSHIQYHNKYIKECYGEEIDHLYGIETAIKKYANINLASGYAELNPTKIDQTICAIWCKEHYNNINEVVNQWETCNYETEIIHFGSNEIKRCRRKQSTINEEVIKQLEQLQSNPDKYVFASANRLLTTIKDDYPILFQGKELLGMDKIKELGFDNKKIKAALITMSNVNAEAKLRILLIKTFKLGQRYPKKYIKDKLQEFYDELQIKKENGQRKIAKATHLDDYGLFKIHPYKEDNVHGFEIQKVCCTLQEAA